MRKWYLRMVLGAAVLLSQMGNGGGGCCAGDHAVLGQSTEATCPTANAPTWDGFAKPFFDKYCTRCHASTLTGSARNGAPEFHDFDTRAGVQGVLNHIDQQAGSGPAATNEIMPPSSPVPTKAERETLAQFVACECQTVTCATGN